MRPRGNQEREVVRLHNQLPDVSAEQMNWMIGQSCERQAKRFAEVRRKVSDHDYFSVVTTFKDWQVVRYFLVHSTTSRKGYDMQSFNEVSQRWMRLDQYGNIALHIFEKQKAMCWQWKSQPYCLGSELSLKPWSKDYQRSGRTCFYMGDQEVYPVREFSDEFKHSELAKCLGRSDEINLAKNQARELKAYKSLELSTEKVETLTKSNYIPVIYETLMKIGERTLAYIVLHGLDYSKLVKQYWKSFLVARRHGYKPAEWSLWFDYVHDLDAIGKDIHSPHYLCPEDLGVAHGEVLRRLEVIRRRKAQERDERARIREERKNKLLQVDYTKRMQGFFGICIVTQSGITISPLQSVDAFREEGNAMHHCVYSNGYYKRPECLILSARDKDGKRVETIEVNLDSYRVVQSRGVCNKPTAYHEEIVKAMNSNMGKIRAVNRMAVAA